MPESDLDLLIRTAREAGDIARAHFERGVQSWDKPGGAGPVTDADLAVDRHLKAALQDARPDYGWLSEETPDSPDRLNKETVFIVDPIDGTRSFVDGHRTWAHSLAVVHNGVPVAGAVYLPMREKLYAADTSCGARLQTGDGTVDISVSHQPDLHLADVLCTKPSLTPKHWRGVDAPAFARSHRPSLAYRLALVAEGRFDAMLTLRPTWEWDIAAGALIAQAAGATVTDAAGKPLEFNSKQAQTPGVLVGGSAIHQDLFGRLTPLDEVMTPDPSAQSE